MSDEGEIDWMIAGPYYIDFVQGEQQAAAIEYRSVAHAARVEFNNDIQITRGAFVPKYLWSEE